MNNMNYYIIFKEDGDFKGYTTDKEWARGVIEQRKHFEPLYMRKMKKSKIPKEIRARLNMALKSLIILYDVYVFDDEEEEVMSCIYNQNATMYEFFDAYIGLEQFLKLNERERIILDAFYNIMQSTLGILEGDHTTIDEPLSQIKESIDLTKVCLTALEKRAKFEKDPESVNEQYDNIF